MTIIVVTLILTIVLLSLYILFLERIGFVQLNYKYQNVPISLGAFIFFIELVILIFIKNTLFLSFGFYLLLIVIIGTIDDIFGDKYIKGILNHIKVFFKGRITTGFLKAVTGFLISVFLSKKIGNNTYEYITHFFLILFMINAFNLLDLRPGRALKVFFILFIMLTIINTSFITDEFGLVVASILLVVFYYDIRGKLMLGDSGANLIGLHLGIWYSIYAPIIIEWTLIVLLILVHIYTEKYSLSKLIEDNKFLLKIDSWGRYDNIRGKDK